MGEKWEYFVAKMSIGDGKCEYVTSEKTGGVPTYQKSLLGKDEQDVLTFLGDCGWELVSIFEGRVWFGTGSMTAKCLYFKRQKR